MIQTAARMNALQRMARPRLPTQFGSPSLLARAPSAAAGAGASAATAAARRTLFTRKTPAQRLKGRLWTGAGLILGGLFAVYAYDSSAGVHRCVASATQCPELSGFRPSGFSDACIHPCCSDPPLQMARRPSAAHIHKGRPRGVAQVRNKGPCKRTVARRHPGGSGGCLGL